MAEIRFSSLAQKDLEDSSKWYEEQREGFGDFFAEIIYKAPVRKVSLEYRIINTEYRISK
jgi:hypothetical protein